LSDKRGEVARCSGAHAGQQVLVGRRSLNHLARQWHDHSQRLAPDPPAPSPKSAGRTGPERRSPGLEM
jgi:hypothetical protein